MTQDTYKSLKSFESREDLKRYGSEAWAIFALELKYDLEDIHTVAADSITDGKNDRKCDLIYLSPEFNVAIIAQSYFSDRIKKSAKKNKASDLNTAAAWVLERNIEELPLLIRPQVEALRAMLLSKEIEHIEFWYIHNCHENKEIESELKTVELTAKKLVEQYGSHVKVKALEVGIETLESWYEYSKNTILVTDSFAIETTGGYQSKTDDWQVYSTMISAEWIYDLIKKYEDKLFSANVRGYLGSMKRESNINNGIKITATKEPQNLLVYNNGITALVNDLEIDSEGSENKIKIEGISIVNGAQTTGALGSLDDSPKDALVPVRFIKCSKNEIIRKIIQFNNSQNTVEASDFRSTDPIQEKLRKGFKSMYPELNYLGARRGGTEDKIKRNRNTLVSDQVAQSLTAFHGDPLNATHYKSKIWEDDNLYGKVFNESTTAQHILFVYSLYKSLLDYKQMLKEISKANTLKSADEKTLEFLGHPGSIYAIMYAVSFSMEQVLDKKIGNQFNCRFKEEIGLDRSLEIWRGILQCMIPFVTTSLKPIVDAKVKKQDLNIGSAEQFSSLIGSTREINKTVYDEFTANVVVN